MSSKNNPDEIISTSEKLENLEIEKSEEVPEIAQIIVKYCDICRFPEEYCEYTHTIFAKGINNLNLQTSANPPKKDENESKKDTDENKQKEVTVGSDVTKDATVKDDKNKKEKKLPEKKAENNKIQIKVSKRGSKKFATHVYGLELFNLSLKDVAKLFSKKFACSSTVSKENGKDCICLTGEFTYEIVDFLKEKFPIITEDNCHISEVK